MSWLQYRGASVLAAALGLAMSSASAIRAQPSEPATGEAGADASVPVDAPPAPAEAAAEQAAVPEEGAAVAAEPAADQPAANVAATADVAAEGDEGDIVVTGSRLKRSSSFDAPSPVQVVDRAAMASSGAGNMRELIANIPINFGGQNNAGLGTGTGVRGAALFDLHGMGPSTTLVLVNGRRLLRTGLTIDGQQFDNAAQIPMAFVDRVEIMKGGGSAIYGSDAVSGVVNIITRRKYDGLDVQLSGNLATQPGNLRDGEVAVTLGTASDKTAAAVNVTYYERTELRATDRPYSMGNPNSPQWPFPTPVPAGATFPAPFATPTLSSGSGNPGNFSLVPTPMGAPMSRPDPLCASAPNAYLRGGVCSFLFTPYYHYVYPENRLNVYSTLAHDFSDHVTAFGEFGYMRVDIENTISPSYVLNKEILVPLDHPDIPAEWRADITQAMATAQLTGGSAKLRFGPVGSRTRGGDYPPMLLSTSSEGVRFVAGLKGDFADVGAGSLFEDWDWELSVTHQRNVFLDSQPDDLAGNLQRALNACSQTSPDFGAVPCYHPFYADQARNVTERNNLLGQTATEYIMGQAIGKTTSAMWVGDAMLRGQLLRLPGGPLGLAIGAQGRYESIRYTSDYDSNRGNYASIGGTPNYTGERNILALYGELSAPLISGLELQGALRYERYQDVGQGSLDPKLGLSWAPFNKDFGAALAGLRVRGGVATSFRGPSLFQSYGRLVALQEFTEANGRTFRMVTTRGNLGLSPERSLALNAGIEWAFGGLRLEADYFRFTYEDVIVKENPTARVTACQAAMAMGADPTQSPACAGASFLGGSLVSVDVPFINASSAKTHGLDFGGTFRFGDRERLGMVTIGANGSYVISYRLQADAKSKVIEAAGRRNTDNFAPALPRLRMNIPVGWSYRGHNVQLTGAFIGSYRDEQNARRDMNGPIPGTEPLIDAWFTLNVQYGFRIENWFGKATTLTVGATNVLDADPPFVQTNLGYDITMHDPRGRMLFGRLAQEF